MNRYVLSEMAIADMDAIWDYIGIVNDNPQAARRQTKDIQAMFQRLANNPNVGQRRDDLRPNIRLFSVGNYVVLFYPIDDGVEVAGIIHGARDLEGLFDRGER